MEPTVIVTEHPTFEEIKHNALVFLRLNIREIDEFMAGECPPELYDFNASLREKQCAKLRRVEAATCYEELREKSERRHSTANSRHTTREQTLERQAAQAKQEKLMQQVFELCRQTYRCSEEEKPALEAQIHALREEINDLYYLAIYPLS
jgi:hypothetical protein